MSRASINPGPSGRNPSLLEELEKLEQSITLTLQEIDSNFSRAHRIVTTSIIPIVQQYAKHSETVLDGSKFWKSFFEASANVTLSGYEAPPEDSYVPEDNTATNASSVYDATGTINDDDTITDTTATPPRSRSEQSGREETELDSNIMSSPSLAAAHSTPRHPSTVKKVTRRDPAEGDATFASYGSPYESLKRELQGGQGDAQTHSGYEPGSASQAPITPAKSHLFPDTSMTPDSSPFNPATSRTSHHTQHEQSDDPLLHHVLDKTYRIQATPHRSARKPYVAAAGRGFKSSTGLTPANTSTVRNPALDSSPLDSSPEIAAPQLRAELFSSPVKGFAPRTPGTQTPRSALKTRTFVPGSAAKVFKSRSDYTTGASGTAAGMSSRVADIWDSDEDELDELGFSPPKTMQFHIPQSRLLQTPAREASKRIVEDLLLTAGGGEITDDLDESQASPSIIRGGAELDETF